jgi:hypothetical protein
MEMQDVSRGTLQEGVDFVARHIKRMFHVEQFNH